MALFFASRLVYMSGYREIAAGFRQDIVSGKLKQGDRLPSESQLMASTSAARGTVRAALRLLHDEGFIHSEQGRGAFVGPSTDPGERARDLRRAAALLLVIADELEATRAPGPSGR